MLYKTYGDKSAKAIRSLVFCLLRYTSSWKIPYAVEWQKACPRPIIGPILVRP